MWRCTDCEPKFRIAFHFEDKEAWLEHIEWVHRGTFLATELPSFEKYSQHQMLKPVDCPVCGYKVEEQQLKLDVHIAEHPLSLDWTSDEGFVLSDDPTSD
jgi:hypothetical protein